MCKYNLVYLYGNKLNCIYQIFNSRFLLMLRDLTPEERADAFYQHLKVNMTHLKEIETPVNINGMQFGCFSLGPHQL